MSCHQIHHRMQSSSYDDQRVSLLDEEQCHHTINKKVDNTLQYTSYKLPYLEC